jgi:hypothetical protein
MNDDATGTDRQLFAMGAESKPSRWLDAIAPGLYRTWRERSMARQMSRTALQVYREVEADRPEISGVSRYREVVARQTGFDEQCVRRIIAGAESSFAIWPVERPLKFRDVVQYLVVYQCLAVAPRALGTRSRLTTIIEEIIPDEC